MPLDAARGGLVRRGLRRLSGRRADVTVVVGCAERDKDLLPGCVESLQRQSHPYVDVRVAAPEERNDEATRARGRYLLFLDASERLTHTALADLVAALEASGSDLALAGMPQDRAGVNLTEAPEAVTGPSLGGTLFRRAFWTRSGLRAPADSAAPLLVRACVLADRFDLLRRVVCEETDRDATLPFGHVPHLADAIDPWLDAVAEVDGLLRAPKHAEARRRWLHDLLDDEAHRFIDAVEQASPAQWERLSEMLGRLADEVASRPEAWGALRWESRVKGWLVAQRRRVVLEEFVEARRVGDGVPTEVRDGAVYAVEPAADGVPDDCLRLTEAETALVASLRQIRWVDETLELGVFAYPRLVGDDPTQPEPELAAELVDEQGVRRTPLKVTPTPSPAATRFAKEPHQTHDLGDYRITITADQVLGATAWELELTWRGYGLTRTGTINHRDHNGILGERPRRMAAGKLWGPSPVGDDGMRIEVHRPGAVLADPAVSGRRVSGRLVELSTDAPLVAVELEHPSRAPVRADLDAEGRFAVTLPDVGFVNRDDQAAEWRLYALDAEDTEQLVAFPPEVEPRRGEPSAVLSWRRSRWGAAAVQEISCRVVVRDVRLDGDDLVLEGYWLDGAPESPSFALVGERARIPGVVGERGSVVFSMRCDEWGLGATTAPAGAYRLEMVLPSGETTGAIDVAEELTERTQFDLLGERLRVRVRQNPRRRLALHVMPPLRDDELGVRAQRLQQVRFATTSYSLDPTAVYFQSYTGQVATDSPRAIHEVLRRTRPDLKLFWGIEDWSVQVPGGAVPVLIRSREWYDVLGSAGWLVNNIDFDRWFVKRPGQRFLQTFHGYPAKTMGLVQWRAKQHGQRRIEGELDRTARKWDLILTPSPEMDEHYRREYAYDGPIHNQGYPRDDLLVSFEASGVGEETRRLLGIGPHQKVVLFAPTFRDHLSVDHRKAVLARHLDLEKASEVLGPDYVFLLRGHRFHAKGERRLARTRRLIDVTDYPEINHLILAADAAVLDYSSLRFDFALTGRPMVFLVPDLEVYSGGVRGFLYDFASSAPGPLVRDATEVVDLLRDIDGLAARYAPEIAAFNERFQAFQDGHAAERVVEAFFSELSGA